MRYALCIGRDVCVYVGGSNTHSAKAGLVMIATHGWMDEWIIKGVLVLY